MLESDFLLYIFPGIWYLEEFSYILSWCFQKFSLRLYIILMLHFDELKYVDSEIQFDKIEQ